MLTVQYPRGWYTLPLPHCLLRPTPTSPCACFFSPGGWFSFLRPLSLLSLFHSSLSFLFSSPLFSPFSSFPFSSARHSLSSFLLTLFFFTPSLPPLAPFTSFHRIIFSLFLLSSQPPSFFIHLSIPLLYTRYTPSSLDIPLSLDHTPISVTSHHQGHHPQLCHTSLFFRALSNIHHLSVA